MTKKIVFGMALALVIAVVAVPSVSAACNPPKSASTYNGVTFVTAYWTTTLPKVGATVKGKIWSGSTDFTGTCNDQNFMYFTYDGGVNMSLSLGDACVPGCPTGSLSAMAMITNNGATEFLATQTPETPSGGNNFDFSTLGHAMVPVPRPRATNSSRAGSTINLNIAVDAAASGLYDGTAAQITGYNILAASSVADPGRDASAYALRVALPAAGGGAGAGSTSVDCTDASKSQWLVTQIVTAAGPAPLVSAPTRVSCGPAVADPKFKIINKKTMGTGPVKN